MLFKNKKKGGNAFKRKPFAVVEAYNTIRTNIIFLLSQHKDKIVCISSPEEGEGKSTTVVNTAIAFSQLGKKTLIIDADLRKPTIHKKLKVDNAKGFSNILVGFCNFDEAVKEINPMLDVLTSGPTPPNPSELLGSVQADTLLAELSKKYDYIFIDTPPINIVSDILVMAPKTDGIILVIKDYETTHDEFKHALASTEFASIKLLGVVLNRVNPQNNDKKYKYKYKYHRYSYYSQDYRSEYINKN